MAKVHPMMASSALTTSQQYKVATDMNVISAKSVSGHKFKQRSQTLCTRDMHNAVAKCEK